jgi:hypothetical protein
LFLDPPRVVRLCQEMEEVRGNPATRPQGAKADRPLIAEAIVDRPQRLVRTAVATMQRTEGFGWMVAAEPSVEAASAAPHKRSCTLSPSVEPGRADNDLTTPSAECYNRHGQFGKLASSGSR